jgi:hypothetical protein
MLTRDEILRSREFNERYGDREHESGTGLPSRNQAGLRLKKKARPSLSVPKKPPVRIQRDPKTGRLTYLEKAS